jgi:hypothetical protein
MHYCSYANHLEVQQNVNFSPTFRTYLVRQNVILSDKIQFIYLLIWLYIQDLVQACLRRSLHCDLSRAKFVQSRASRALLSLFTPFAHLDFGLPCFCLEMAGSRQRRWEEGGKCNERKKEKHGLAKRH